MPYPDQIDRFTKKLNKKLDGSMYVIEEELPISDGVYNCPLGHDNITNSTIKIYTGSQLTGDPVENFIVSIPEDTPWKRSIKIFASVALVYVAYETPGDMVEAEDVNELQASIVAIQAEIEGYKAEGVIDGGAFIREEG